MTMLKKEEQDLLYNTAIARREAAAAAEAIADKKVGSSVGVDPLPEGKKKELITVGDIPAIAKNVDNAVRVAAGPMGDALAGFMSPGDTRENILYEAAKTRMAKAALGQATSPNVAEGVEVAGDVGKVLALPGSLFATPLRASMTSSGIGVIDTLFDRLSKGEPVNTEAEEYLTNAATGAAGGLLGYHVGKVMGNFISRFAGKDSGLNAAAKKAVVESRDTAEAGTKALRDSGVTVNAFGQARLLNGIEKSLSKTYELSPKTTPAAWRAISILRARVGEGADITLENFNALRNSVGKSLYAESGLLRREVTGRDLEIVDDIYNSMTKFIENLPNTRNFIRSGGDLQAGLSGWNTMTKFQQKQARTEKIAELIANAEASKEPFEQALQNEFRSLTAKGEHRKLAERMFSKEQIAAIEKIARGDLSKRAFDKLDEWFGSSLIALIFRPVRSLHGGVFEAEESRFAARKIIERIGGVKGTNVVGPKRFGVATVMEEKKRIENSK